jgi:hypothetical protein
MELVRQKRRDAGCQKARQLFANATIENGRSSCDVVADERRVTIRGTL